MKIKIFGLLHLSENEQSATNLSIKNFQEQVSVYVNNATVFSKSLYLKGIEFSLLTNNKLLVEKCAPATSDGFSLEIIEIPFITKVPSGIRFFSAHYKIDAFRYLASLKDSYYVLCDLDVVCINEVPVCLYNIVKERIPLCYDISDQVIPVYGHDVIIRDISSINRIKSEGRWSGGEFISGDPEFFKKLVGEIDVIYDNYIANIPSLHHVGDEAVVSAAIEKLKRKGVYIADAGNIFIVGRFWNANVLHPQHQFAYYKNCFLLHLPADKKFISDFATLGARDLANFMSVYENYVDSFSSKMKKKVKLFARIIINAINKVLQQTAKRIALHKSL